MTWAISDVHPFHQLLISMALGLLVGLQRERVDAPLGGIRTFSLVSVFGTVCALLTATYGTWLIGAGLLSVTAAMVVGRISMKDAALPGHSGLVSEVAMLLMFFSGVLVSGPVWIGAALAGILAVVLQAKTPLHGLARRFSDEETRAIMQFVLISLVVFPVVPDETFGPLAVLNPHDIWLMVTVIVAVSLAGYIVYKFFGAGAGVLLGGILGGVISSTATTASYSRRSKETGSSVAQNALIVLIAWTTVYVRLFVEVLIAAPGFRAVWLPLGVLFVVSALSTLWLWRGMSQPAAALPPPGNPAELKTALMFGALYALILFAVAFSRQYLGESGLTVVAALSGITDMDAITLSTARLVGAGKLLEHEGWPVIIVACMSNVAFKGAIAGFVGGRAFFKALVVPWLCSLAAGGALLLAWWR